jgi:hypothetical protein
MFDPKHHDFCSEFYTVEESIEVVLRIAKEERRIRIDALRNARDGRFSTKAYIEEDVTAQPTYPQTGDSFDRKPKHIRVWISYDLPWTNRDSAEGALQQALSFLRPSSSA